MRACVCKRVCACVCGCMCLCVRVSSHTLSPRSLYQRAIAVQEAVYGPNSPETARTLNSLGNVYQAMLRNEDARTAYERALAIQVCGMSVSLCRGADPLNTLLMPQEAAGDAVFVAETLVNLGTLAEASSDHLTAEPLYRRALEIQEKELGDHHDTAATLSNLGMLYQVTPQMLDHLTCVY